VTSSAIVIGGGIIGCATACELARAGWRVTLIERHRPGAEASSAAAGLLFSLGDSPEIDAFHDLARRSVQLYRGVADELRDLTAIDVEYMTAGTIYPLLSASELAGARARARWPSARELGVEVLEGAAVHEREPALAKDIAAALFVHADHWVNNERLVLAYAAAAARRGADVRSGIEVSEIVVEGGRARGVLAAGERIDADAVLIAAGAWSGALIAGVAGGVAAGRAVALPVEPVKGQMLAVSNSPPLLSHAVHAGEVYLVPRPSGELLIGATVEHAGFARDVTAGGLAGLIHDAVRLVPEVARRPVTRSWYGFRPWVPDGMPVLGPWPGVAGLYVATAHYRNGIVLAPITAVLMAEAIVSGRTPDLLVPFLPDRLQPAAPRAARHDA
jgi:glycine oxidase